MCRTCKVHGTPTNEDQVVPTIFIDWCIIIIASRNEWSSGSPTKVSSSMVLNNQKHKDITPGPSYSSPQTAKVGQNFLPYNS